MNPSPKQKERYPGFPRMVQRVQVPRPLLNSLLAQIDDIAELKCTLRVVALLSQKRGYPRFVTLHELQADESLVRAIPAEDETTSATLIERALGSAVRRGTLAYVIRGTGNSREPILGLILNLTGSPLRRPRRSRHLGLRRTRSRPTRP